MYSWKKKLDYKGCLEREEVYEIKFKLWQELKDFLLDQLDENSYLSSLQLKRKEKITINKNTLKSTIIRSITKEGFDMQDKKFHYLMMKILNSQK